MPTCSRQTLVKGHAFLVKPAYYLKSLYGVRGFNASLWRFLLRCTLFCHSVATFLTSMSSKLRASRLSGKKSLIRRADIELMMKTKPYERIMPKEDFDITEYYTAEEIAQKYKVNAKWVWTYTRQHIVLKGK